MSSPGFDGRNYYYNPQSSSGDYAARPASKSNYQDYGVVVDNGPFFAYPTGGFRSSSPFSMDIVGTGTDDMYRDYDIRPAVMPYYDENGVLKNPGGIANPESHVNPISATAPGENMPVPSPAPAPAPATGATIDPSQSTLSPNFAPYVYDMLRSAQTAASRPFMPYMGQRFAGTSPLEQQAFRGLGNLQMPYQYGMASDIYGQAAQRAGVMGYQPNYFGNQFQAPQQYQAATDLTAGMGPQQYQAGQFQTGLGPVGSVQDYMNQYQQGVTDIAAREAKRQSDIQSLQDRSAFAKAGAFGGSRQAIVEAERQRNLAQQLGDIQQRGLAGAFESAQKQRLSEAGMGLDAQRALEQSRQYGAGLTQQGLGQLLQARQAQEASRQFGAQQGMQGAQLGAQYGTEAQRMAEQSRQYGADFGLRALQQQMAAAQGLGAIGGQQFGSQLQGLRDILGAGGTQRQIAQQPLDFGYQQWQESLQYPYKQATFLSSMLAGMPVGAAPYRPATDSDSGFASALQGGLSGLALYNLFNPKQ